MLVPTSRLSIFSYHLLCKKLVTKHLATFMKFTVIYMLPSSLLTRKMHDAYNIHFFHFGKNVVFLIRLFY
jgi:hypothetical protein